MPESTKGRVQKKCSPWSSRFGVGRGANDPKTEKFTVIAPVNNNNNNNNKTTMKQEKALNKDSYHTDRLLSLRERGFVGIHGSSIRK
jgi:hypothetical protein